jgi:hypothetical protein
MLVIGIVLGVLADLERSLSQFISRPMARGASRCGIPDLRDEDGLKLRPEGERNAWRAFWGDVAEVLKKAG